MLTHTHSYLPRVSCVRETNSAVHRLTRYNRFYIGMTTLRIDTHVIECSSSQCSVALLLCVSLITCVCWHVTYAEELLP